MTTLPDTEYQYPGGELELFAEATNWKRYWHSRVERFIRGDVLEVGAGIGANTAMLRNEASFRWVCVEPDASLAETLQSNVASLECECLVGTVNDMAASELFDTALYIDVLEHIEDHEAEAARAVAHLRPGGHLVMLGPAHPFLYSPFDTHVGHVRRYTRENIPVVAGCDLVHSEFLDSVGMAASFANRVLLRASLPTKVQIRTWDSFMVPVSRLIDPLFARRLGKSILAVWQKR